jgi:hypothetical protein
VTFRLADDAPAAAPSLGHGAMNSEGVTMRRVDDVAASESRPLAEPQAGKRKACHRRDKVSRQSIEQPFEITRADRPALASRAATRRFRRECRRHSDTSISDRMREHSPEHCQCPACSRGRRTARRNVAQPPSNVSRRDGTNRKLAERRRDPTFVLPRLCIAGARSYSRARRQPISSNLV